MTAPHGLTRRAACAATALWPLAPVSPMLAGCSRHDGIPRRPTPPAPAELPPLPPVPEGAVFPLRTERGRRHLVDASGRPFLITGDSAWSLLAQLSRAEMDLYLRDRRQRGFNAVLLSVLECYFSRRPPYNSEGQVPFDSPRTFSNVAEYLQHVDYDTPNPAYFDLFDHLLGRAAELDILVLATPSYVGYEGGEQGWWGAMKRNGAARLRSYGRFLGRRCRQHRNLLWVQGGDYDVPDRSLVDAIALGIREYDRDNLHTFHAGRGTGAHDWMGQARWLDLGNIYTGEVVYEKALRYRAQRPDEPFFLIEAYYEEARPDPRLTRAQAYQALLSGACGQLCGHHDLWQFLPNWREALDSVTSRSMTQLSRLFGALPWWRLVPDTEHRLLTGGLGAGLDRALAAVVPETSFGIVYAPTLEPLQFDLSRLAARGPLRVRWQDPVDAAAVDATPPPAADLARLELAPPGRNSVGATDWLLLIYQAGA